MAISLSQNGHFDEMGACLQILQTVGNSTLLYLLFEIYDSPGSVIWKSKFTIGFGIVGNILVKYPCVMFKLKIKSWTESNRLAVA